LCVFCNVWVCVYVRFLMYGCFDNYVGVLVICVIVFIACLYYFFMYIYSYMLPV